MQITMTEAQVDVQPIPGGDGKLIICVDKAGNTLIIPLSSEGAKQVGTKLITGLLVASGPLKTNGSAH